MHSTGPARKASDGVRGVCVSWSGKFQSSKKLAATTPAECLFIWDSKAVRTIGLADQPEHERPSHSPSWLSRHRAAAVCSLKSSSISYSWEQRLVYPGLWEYQAGTLIGPRASCLGVSNSWTFFQAIDVNFARVA